MRSETLLRSREKKKYNRGERYVQKSSTGWLKHLDFMILDIICLQLAFIMGYFLRHHSLNPYGNTIYRNEAIVFMLIQVMIMFFDDSFKNVMKRGYLSEIEKQSKT